MKGQWCPKEGPGQTDGRHHIPCLGRSCVVILQAVQGPRETIAAMGRLGQGFLM